MERVIQEEDLGVVKIQGGHIFWNLGILYTVLVATPEEEQMSSRAHSIE